MRSHQHLEYDSFGEEKFQRRVILSFEREVVCRIKEVAGIFRVRFACGLPTGKAMNRIRLVFPSSLVVLNRSFLISLRGTLPFSGAEMQLKFVSEQPLSW